MPQLDTTANSDTAATPGTCAGAARLALQPQQHRYVGKFAETAETPAIRLELPVLATTLQAAQFPPAAAIPAHSTIQCPPRSTHHIQAPSPLARPFGVPSPCGKNKQENCWFPWEWQPRRPGKRARSHHPALHRASTRARTRARPAATITSTHTSTTSLTPLVQLTSARALLALHHARAFALRRAPAVLLRPSPLSRWVHPCPHNSSPCAGPRAPLTRTDPAGALA